ncbi:MAG: hypothetical protein L5656_08690 [Thermanaeromonas sp.]|uniref:hypothetical protein n=1 Tax=Thermanaeromonas sp. TaxID=2003697 RepID=UPI00243E0F9F|nr:hypothetical protein [Thermanaeromonas sp.]MCG0278589.1 hypothetical protein [Thermanaeromonas sp.]
MGLYFRFAVPGLEVAVKGREEAVKELLKEMLGHKFQQILDSCVLRAPNRVETVSPNKAVKNKAAEANASEAEAVQGPSLAAIYSKANISNNNELILLVVYYMDYCRKTPPDNGLIRKLLRDELNARDEVINSVTTYLKRARNQGWIERQGKVWHVTPLGLEKMQKILGPWALEEDKGGP